MLETEKRSSLIPNDVELKDFEVIGEFNNSMFWNNTFERNCMQFVSSMKFILKKYNSQIDVYSGFQTDGGSIPRLFWTSVGDPFATRAFCAYLLHDAIYGIEAFPRKVCDMILLEFLKELKVPWLTRNQIWIAVKLFGGKVWEKHPEYRSIEINSQFVKKIEYINNNDIKKVIVYERF